MLWTDTYDRPRWPLVVLHQNKNWHLRITSTFSVLRFDVIVTCTATKANDRRSLTGELKRSAPEATVILIAESGNEDKRRQYAGVSAVVTPQLRSMQYAEW